jgi:hypothetical protein
MDGSALNFGNIVLADILDPDGKPCEEPHRAMILRGPDSAGTVYLVGITSSFSPGARFEIPLPWHPAGHPFTGLTMECVAKCRWVVKFNVSQIIRCVGNMPAEIASQIVEYVTTAVIEEKVRRP